MSTLMTHPDGTFCVSYANNSLKVSVWNEAKQDDDGAEIQLTPIGLIDLGQRLVKEGVAILIDNPA